MSRPDLSIVLPCYNEGPNIPLIIERIRPFWPTENFELILVNNGSSDDSAERMAAESAKPENSFVRIVTVPVNLGYGHGIFTGLQAAKAPILAYSHADIQTPPEDIFQAFHILAEQKLDPDKAIIKGHRINRDPNALVLTNGLAKVVEIVLGHKMEDINGQPKLFSRYLFNQFTHPPKGFAFDVYVLYTAQLAGLTLIEFPVDFGVRVHGQSKWASTIFSRYKTIWRFLRSIGDIAWHHYEAPGNLLKQLVRFGVSGILTNVVNYATFWVLLRWLSVFYVAASVVGFLAGFAVSFAVNRQWTFGATDGDSGGQLARFFAVNGLSLGVNAATIWLFTAVFRLPPELSQIIAIGVSAIVNFIGSKFWVFANNKS